VEIGRAGEILADQLGADDRAVLLLHQAAMGLVREERAGEIGHRQRVTQAEDQRQDDGGQKGLSDVFEHV